MKDRMSIKDKMYFTFTFDLDGDFLYRNDYKPYNHTIDNNAILSIKENNIFVKPSKQHTDGDYDFTSKKIPISYIKDNNCIFYIRGEKTNPISFGFSMICERDKRNKFHFESDLNSVKELIKKIFIKDVINYIDKVNEVVDVLKEHESSLNNNKYPINPFPCINEI
jgi:hypothetical protein